MQVRFIGDVHGNISQYLKLIEGTDFSVQLGDMGLGFSGVKLPLLPKEHGFIRGNHDNPAVCRRHPNWLSDGLYDSELNIFYVGGAWSIDFEWRQEHKSRTGKALWWPNEECSVSQFNEIIDWYEECKPAIMATHDCPSIMAKELLSHHSLDRSKTRLALDTMFGIHKPDAWVFGHHHKNLTKEINSTTFFCLAELQCLDMEV